MPAAASDRVAGIGITIEHVRAMVRALGYLNELEEEGWRLFALSDRNPPVSSRPNSSDRLAERGYVFFRSVLAKSCHSANGPFSAIRLAISIVASVSHRR